MAFQSIVILIMGVCGCGKTLLGEMLAQRLGFTFADADDYHPLANKEKMRSGVPLTDEDRYAWLIELSKLIDNWLTQGINGILACSALKEQYRQLLIREPSYTQIIFLKGNYDLISQRLAERQHPFMNPTLLRSQFATLEEPSAAICLDAALSPELLLQSACQSLLQAEKARGRVLTGFN